MEDHKMKELMMDYLEGNLSGELKEFVAKHIEKDEQWIKEFEALKEVLAILDNTKILEPDASLKTNFDAMLSEEMAKENNQIQSIVPKVVYWNSTKMWMQIAASVSILVVGVLLGVNYTNNKAELLALQKELEATKQMVLSSLDNQSASSRLNAVNVSYQIDKMDDDIINALVKTLNTDENANVRMAALQALATLADEEKVRTALIHSLSVQDKPVVQIALINLMIELKENRAIKPLKKIIDSNEMIDAVKDEANYGIFKLS